MSVMVRPSPPSGDGVDVPGEAGGEVGAGLLPPQAAAVARSRTARIRAQVFFIEQLLFRILTANQAICWDFITGGPGGQLRTRRKSGGGAVNLMWKNIGKNGKLLKTSETRIKTAIFRPAAGTAAIFVR